MKAFLINLEKAKDRLNSCDEEFKKIGLDYILVKAVDGKKITFQERIFKTVYTPKNMAKELIPEKWHVIRVT